MTMQYQKTVKALKSGARKTELDPALINALKNLEMTIASLEKVNFIYGTMNMPIRKTLRDLKGQKDNLAKVMKRIELFGKQT